MGYDLAVVGDLVADLIVPVERLPIEANKHSWAKGIFVEPGGAGNVLVAARRMDLATTSLAPLGADRYGEEIVAMLEAEGVDVSHVIAFAKRPTVICIVLTDALGQHVFLAVQDDFGPWPFPVAWHDVIRGSRAMYTDGYSLAHFLEPEDVIAACQTARGAGVPVFFDSSPSIHFVPPDTRDRALACVDVLLVNQDEAAHLAEAGDPEGTARALLELGPSVAVLKLGPEGCIVATGHDAVHVPGFNVEVADTVGAGDAFAAAFIAGWLRGASLADCARLANAMGAVTSTQRGAGTRIPGRERLGELLADYPSAARHIDGS